MVQPTLTVQPPPLMAVFPCPGEHFLICISSLQRSGDEDNSEIYLNNTQIKLYRGVCYLETNAHFEADAIFTEIEKSNTAFSYTATWYKALNYLKQNNYLECKKILKTIPKHSNEYNKAQKLIKQL